MGPGPGIATVCAKAKLARLARAQLLGESSGSVAPSIAFAGMQAALRLGRGSAMEQVGGTRQKVQLKRRLFATEKAQAEAQTVTLKMQTYLF